MTGETMAPETAPTRRSPQGRRGRAGAAKRLPLFVAILSAATFRSALSAASAACDAAVDRAALQAVNKIPVIGQTSVLGQPFTIDRGVLRAEVDVFGPQNQVYAVDVTIDSACRMLPTSTRLESESESPR
jgi:hypothetical protein